MPVVELWFGKIDGGVASSSMARRSVARRLARRLGYDVKKLLRAGENVLAVTLANYGPAAGLNKGVALRLQDNPQRWPGAAASSMAWPRSSCNRRRSRARSSSPRAPRALVNKSPNRDPCGSCSLCFALIGKGAGQRELAEPTGAHRGADAP